MPSKDNPKRSQTKDKTFAAVGSGIFSCLRGGVGLLPPLDIGSSTFLRNIVRPALGSYVDVKTPSEERMSTTTSRGRDIIVILWAAVQAFLSERYYIP